MWVKRSGDWHIRSIELDLSRRAPSTQSELADAILPPSRIRDLTLPRDSQNAPGFEALRETGRPVWLQLIPRPTRLTIREGNSTIEVGHSRTMLSSPCAPPQRGGNECHRIGFVSNTHQEDDE